VLLAYSDFNKPFHIYTDASDHQLGAVIMQDKKPIAFYSRKRNAAQRRYTTTERELLSTIETCKEYKNILLGYPIIVYTDHKNNTYNGLKASDRVLRWLLLLEEYGVTFEYPPGKKNVVADALSRLDIDDLKIQEEEVLALLSASEFSNIKFPMHTALIFKEQMKVQGLREKGLSQNPTTLCNNILKAMTFYILRTNMHSSVLKRKSTLLIPCIFTSSRTNLY
jgi:RNase H-like domain found in reverse transcriptase